jgi:imidazolonepropionase
MPAARLAVLNCAQLVTLAGPNRPRVGPEMRELGIIENGAMLVEGGFIQSVGTTAEIQAQAGAQTEVVDAAGKVVLPGWVDAHTHAVFGGNRVEEYEQRAAGATYQQIAAAGGGIRSTMRHTRAATEDELVEVGKRHADWFLRGGTTTIEAKSGYGLRVEDELKILRAIRRLGQETPLTFSPTFLGAHALPPEFEERASTRSEAMELYAQSVIEEQLPRVAEEGLASWADIFVEENYFTPAQPRRILGEAKRLGLGLRMHVDQLTDQGGAALAAELGAKTADHLEQTGLPGIRALMGTGVQPVLLPASVYALGLKRYPDARAIIDAGLAVVLATDFNPGSAPTPSMPMILSLACTQMRMTPAEAITAAAINAAHSLDLGHDRGSLEAGKRADLAIYDCKDHREIPYFFGVEHAERVYVEGVCHFKR